jgi:hypothetical protein
MAAQNEAMLEKMRLQIDNFLKSRFGCETQLLDPAVRSFLAHSLLSCLHL